MRLVSRKNKTPSTSDVLMAFVLSWDMRGADEVTICSGALDVLRAYLGDRPCCIWKKMGSGLSKISERGIVEIFYAEKNDGHQAALARAMLSGASEFDDGSSLMGASETLDGFLHIPIRVGDDVRGLMSLGVTKKEARDREFVQPLECLGRMLAVSIQQRQDGEQLEAREQQLKSEVKATTRELEQTNKRLIERVQELKTLSSELEKKVEELTSANTAKDQFLSIVSHELRTPLTSLNGFLCVILDGDTGPITDDQKKFLNIAKQSADRLKLLISDLLDISRIEAGRFQMDMGSCSLFDVLHSSVEGLKAQAAMKNIQLRFESNPTLPSIWGDPTRLLQVIDNLITNAIKFTSADAHIDVSSELLGDCIQVSVKDQGPGLVKENLDKIFDLFYQVDASSKRRAGGVGLGLAIARGIVSLHGGRIWVESEPGQGCTFKFTVPLHKSQKAA